MLHNLDAFLDSIHAKLTMLETQLAEVGMLLWHEMSFVIVTIITSVEMLLK